MDSILGKSNKLAIGIYSLNQIVFPLWEKEQTELAVDSPSPLHLVMP